MGDGWKSRKNLNRSLVGGKQGKTNGIQKLEFTLLGSNANGIKAKKDS